MGFVVVLLVMAGALLAAASRAAVQFLRERAWRAALLSLLGAFVLAAPLCLVALEAPGAAPFAAAGALLVTLVLAALLLPRWGNEPLSIVGEPGRVDERDAVFHRFYRLKPGDPELERYYEDRPDLRRFDEMVRKLPDLGEEGSVSYHPLNSPMQLAAVEVMAKLAKGLDEFGEVAGRQTQVDPADVTARLKGFARYLGADLVGTARLRKSWIYSHVGRGEGQWGAPIDLDHPNAIVVACRMDERMVAQAPGAATTTETAIRYLQVGTIAIVLARAIQLMGWRARAHVDGNYWVMCVPVAVDAGLGELGRLGLLITPEFGPRVRLSVVSTDLPLEFDRPLSFGVADFCRRCMKCARVCPSGSVDRGEPREINGVVKWQTRRDTCYYQWRKFGTDCNLCVKACPYSHPAGGIHRVARWISARNPVARRIMLLGDELFYGRDGSSRFRPPYWHRQ